MKLLVFSYKVCWKDHESISGYSTNGGFPMQMEALSELFSQTRLFIFEGATPGPSGLVSIRGNNLSVVPSREPQGTGFGRKLSFAFWFINNLKIAAGEVRRADAVHAVIPGDLGLTGLVLALVFRKPILVRHCGTWGDRSTHANAFVAWLLPKIAGGRNVVLATGGGDVPPEKDRPAISWIFSSALRNGTFERLHPSESWAGGRLRLVFVGRLSKGKNAGAIVRSLPEIRERFPHSTLDVVGDGPLMSELVEEADRLRVTDAVVFHGNVEHSRVLEILQKSNLFIFPTNTPEGFPKAVLEAMACGLPVIASRVSVLPHLVGNGPGVLLDGTEPQDVTRAVLVCAADRERFRGMGIAAKSRARQFTLERWRDTIRDRLEAAWGRPLREERPHHR